ncbi:hypothetical protein T02_915 [Trichinella nativa]|uniref:Uncharacterized protein n=1 Tax=Trichinella nativa TaxID=6335 RepID=A0A0V1LNA7_9BILA|nr:hypothetical protein T02_915 [Trichinella nativa]
MQLDVGLLFFSIFFHQIFHRNGLYLFVHWVAGRSKSLPSPSRIPFSANKPPPGRSANNRKHKTIIRHNNSNNNKKRKIVFTTRPLFDSINIAALRIDDDLGHARKYGRAQLPTAEVSSVCKPAPTVAGQSIDRHWRHWRCWRRPDADAPAQPGPAQCHLCILHIEAAAGGCVRVLFRLRIRSSGMSNGALEKAFLL